MRGLDQRCGDWISGAGIGNEYRIHFVDFSAVRHRNEPYAPGQDTKPRFVTRRRRVGSRLHASGGPCLSPSAGAHRPEPGPVPPPVPGRTPRSSSPAAARTRPWDRKDRCTRRAMPLRDRRRPVPPPADGSPLSICAPRHRPPERRTRNAGPEMQDPRRRNRGPGAGNRMPTQPINRRHRSGQCRRSAGGVDQPGRRPIDTDDHPAGSSAGRWSATSAGPIRNPVKVT